MNNANYMDGVPVKIAEKYKPPPEIYKLSQSLKSKVNLEENYYWKCTAFTYDKQLEQKALTKIEQWKHIRQRDKEQRRERITKRELQRKREDADRQKNLLYSVSYPSTDDLSSSNEEENSEVNDRKHENGKRNLTTKESAPQISITETAASSFHNILQPTVLSYNSNSNVKNCSNYTAPTSKTTCEGKLTNSFNYKDFEDDTSSPFDNIELKTINDLDVLAQVLHNTQIKAPVDEKLNDNLALDLVNKSKESEPELSNHYNIQVINNENIPKKNYLPRFENYNYNFNQDANNIELNDQHTIATDAMHYNENLAPSVNYNGLLKASHFNNKLGLNSSQSNDASHLPHKLQDVLDDHMIKSKSVPDIIKELRDEVRNSEIRRYRNYSYNMEEESLKSAEKGLKNESSIKTCAIMGNNIFKDLDDNGKKLVEQISAMGFPKERVARIVNLMGVDDKKVIEHLIPLSELADLGFDECKISEALIRNEHNKNKALDELIS